MGRVYGPTHIYVYIYIHIYTWTPKVCRIIAFWAIFRGFGPLFYLLWGFRYIYMYCAHTDSICIYGSGSGI